jgi:hypothetical protein
MNTPRSTILITISCWIFALAVLIAPGAAWARPRGGMGCDLASHCRGPNH